MFGPCAKASRSPPHETVMTIEGAYSLFAHLETVYLGCLARRTLIMRNVREVVEAAAGKRILFFPARHDHWLVQTGDGWAAHLAGAIGVSTDAQASWWGGRGVGTVPHGMIAAYGGDTVAAAQAFAARFARELNVTVLVDFDNDSVQTALAVASALGDRLWGVRLDTSATLVDRSLLEEMESDGSFEPTGVNLQLVRRVRDALDGAGYARVRIVASAWPQRQQDPRLRAGRSARGRLWSRLLARTGRERLHGRRGARRRAHPAASADARTARIRGSSRSTRPGARTGRADGSAARPRPCASRPRPARTRRRRPRGPGSARPGRRGATC